MFKHTCRKCKKPVCNICCSIQDPSGNEEFYRIHKSGDVRCVQINLQTTENLEQHSKIYMSNNFECPSCKNMFSTPKDLQDHIEKLHAEEASRSELTLLSEADCSGWIQNTPDQLCL